MNPELNDIWKHMRELGLAALAHANRHAAYISFENPREHELSILQAAHAAELLIKARIAQEHPLLIFEQLPRSTQAVGSTLELRDLLTQGKTLQFSDLPDRLWGVTGLVLPGRSRFEQFGKLRNMIQHFATPPEIDASEETLRFIFEVIDPFINNCWGLYAVDYDEDYEAYLYFASALVHREILFLISPESAECFEDWDVDWSSVSEIYRNEMYARVSQAKKKHLS